MAENDDLSTIMNFSRGSSNDKLLFNTSRERGNLLTSGNEVLNDRATMKSSDFVKKHGRTAAKALDQLDLAHTNSMADQQGQRTGSQIAGDSAISAVNAFGSTFGNLSALGASVLSPNAGIAIAQGTKAATDFTEGFQSDVQQRARKHHGVRAQLDRMDDDELYERDTDTEGKATSKVRSFLRSAGRAAFRYTEDPTMLGEGIASAVGSIAAGGPTSRIVQGLANIGSRVVGGQVVAQGGRWGNAATMPVAVGAMEAGGAYAGNVEQVMAMSHDDLMTKSDLYPDLIQKGYSQDQAKKLIADNAGKRAALVQAPLAAITSRVTGAAHFEAAPLSSTGIRNALQHAASETVEEGIQSATGQFAQNLGIQGAADRDQRLDQDIGGAMAEGAILGFGSAGAMQSPGVALRGAALTARKGLKEAKDAVAKRQANVQADIEKSSPVAPAAITEAVQVAADNAPVVAEGLRELAQAAPQEQRTTADEYISRVENAIASTDDDFRAMTPEQLTVLRDTYGSNRPNKVDMVLAMARMVGDEKYTPEERTSAALFVADQLERNEKTFNSELPAFLENVPHDNESYKAFDSYSKILNAVNSIPAIQEARTWLNKPEASADVDITDDNVSTPAVNQAVRNVTGVAQHSPENVNQATAERVLLQDTKGNIKLSDEQRALLKSSVSLKKATELYQETLTEPEAGSDIVSREIETVGGKKSHQYSMAQHVKRINDAIISGNTEEASFRMDQLHNFAQTMQNKAQALADSLAQGGKRISYRTAGADGKWLPQSQWGSAVQHVGNEGSAAYANRVLAEASALTQLANNMLEINPQFKQKPLAMPAKAVQAAAPIQEETSKKVEPKKAEAPVGKKVEAPAKKAEQLEMPLPAPDNQVIADEIAERESKRLRREAERKDAAKLEAVEAAKEEEKISVTNKYPNLLTGTKEGAVNYFHKAYEFTKEVSSRLPALENPIQTVRELLLKPTELVKFMGRDVEYDLTRQNLNALEDLLSLSKPIMAEMKSRLKNVLTDKKDGQKSLLELFADGSEINRYTRGRALNILERSGKGIRYQQDLTEMAIMAGINAAINNDKGRVKLTAEDIADFLGMNNPADVSDDLVRLYNRGQSLSDFKRGLADSIISYWGVRPNKNTDMAYTAGIAESVAAEVMYGLEKVGLISLVSEYHAPSERTISRVLFDSRTEAMDNLVDELGSAYKLLDEIVLVNPDKPIFLGSPSENVAATQMRNPTTKNSMQARAAIAHEQATPFYANPLVHDFVSAMGMDAFVSFMGGRAYEKGTLNVNHEGSLEGKNRTLETSFKNVLRDFQEVSEYAKRKGIEPTEVQRFYEYNMSKVGRMQMLGLNNPQADKLAREVFMPTKSTIDMTNINEANKFWMGVAQGLGVKTEKKYRADAVADAKQLVDGKYANIISGMQKWLKASDTKKSALMPHIIEELSPVMGSDASMHGLHALLAVAQLNNDIADGKDLSAMQTSMYLEADGKTNGPIMSLLLFAAEGITPSLVRLLRKGGIFIGEKDQTLNKHVQTRDGADLYEASTEATAHFQEEFRQFIKEDSKSVERMNAVERLLSALNADISLTENADGELQLSLKRGVTKNPLTITIYGSGVDGIAAKVTNALLDEIYAKISEGGNNFVDLIDGVDVKQFTNDLTTLMSERVGINPETNAIEYSPAKGSSVGGKSKSPQDFKFSPRQFDALKSHVRVFFVNQMHKGIEDTIIRHVDKSTTALQQATQLQSIALVGAFRSAIVNKLLEKKTDKEKYPDFRDGDFLSRAEMDEILSGLRAFSPFIETATQNFYVSGAEKSDIMETVTVTNSEGKKIKIAMPKSFGTSLDDQMQTPAYMFQPTLAGVKGVPSLVIGTGDGYMMQRAATMRNAPQGTLKVFDGLNIPVKDIDSASTKVNEAVRDAMNQNPMEAVAQSFEAFMKNDPLELLMDESVPQEVRDFVMLELSKAVQGTFTPKKLSSIKEIKAHMDKLTADLNDLVIRKQAMNNVLGRTSMSFDQMASAESPFVQEGEFTFDAATSVEEIAEALNAEVETEYQRLLDDKYDAKGIQDNETKLREDMLFVSSPTDTGARTVSPQSLQYMLDTRGGAFSKDQHNILRAALSSLQNQGYDIAFGSRQEVSDFEAVNSPDTYSATPVNVNGKFVPADKMIYLYNVNGETLVHELVHAATLDKVFNYFNNKDAVSKVDGEAIDRIEGLMSEWLIQKSDMDSPALSEARASASSAVVKALQDGNKAIAVNEFMAWGLSNQEIAADLQKIGVKNPLFKIALDVVKAIKQLIWGDNKSPQVKDDIYSNLRFNTEILMKTPTLTEKMRADARSNSVYQSVATGTNDRLTQVTERFAKKIADFLDDPMSLDNPEVVIKEAEVLASNAQLSATASGAFAWNDQQLDTFHVVQTALATEMGMNSISLGNIHDIFTDVMKNLTVEDFMTDVNSPSERLTAQAKYSFLQGDYGTETDAQGRSNMLGSFLATAIVDEGFREVLAKKPVPKTIKDASGTLDAHLDNLGNAMMDKLSLSLSGADKKASNAKEAIDRLTQVISAQTNEKRTAIEQFGSNGLDRIDEVMKDFINTTSDKVLTKTEGMIEGSSSPLVRAGVRVVRMAATLANQTATEEAANGLLERLNRSENKHTMRELWAEILGRWRDNADVFDMITKVRSVIQQSRQQFREQLPQQLASKFTGKVTKEAWTTMHNSLAKTDVAALYADLGLKGTLSLLTDANALSDRISRSEDTLRKLEPKYADKIIAKGKQLAEFMNTGVTGNNLLRNAHAVAHLYGEQGSAMSGAVKVETVTLVDTLVSMYALDGLEAGTKENMANLIQTERAGVEYTLAYMVGTRKDELAKNNNDITRNNHYKGYVPSENQRGTSLVVLDDAEHNRMISMGYVRVGDYNGSSAERRTGSFGYYYSPVAGKATYNQGVMQTVQQTSMGVLAHNGMTTGLTAGRITEPSKVIRIQRALANQKATAENLMPVFDETGKLTAYERAIDPTKLEMLHRNTDLSQMLGAWRGRQMEEALATEYNNELIGNLKKVWDNTKDKKQFVDLSKSKDPIHQDSWKLIPEELRREIKQVFGEKNGFPIRRDMINDAVGFRSASVGDLWTGQTRWDAKENTWVQRAATTVFGKDAFKYMVNAEKTIQGVVTDAKILIVVKSVVVPVANMVANIHQLANRGVPIRSIIQGMGTKTSEINDYIKRRNRELVLEADLKAAEGEKSLVKIRKINAELKAIKDSYKRMSIYPLIEAGEFSSISEGGISQEDLALANGRWTNMVEKLATKLPDGLKTPYRYGMITRDTSLFKGLARAVQYGDFISKAIMYDDLVNRKKVSSQEALGAIGEEFVNYNRYAGRVRNYAESMGLIWFWNFKLRIMKVAHSMMRNNPARSLLLGLATPTMPIIGSIGSPLTDNFASVLADGRLGYSVGPWMGLRAPSLNPWNALLN